MTKCSDCGKNIPYGTRKKVTVSADDSLRKIQELMEQIGFQTRIVPGDKNNYEYLEVWKDD